MKRLNSIYCILCLGYILGVHNGYIALWKEPYEKPLRVFPYSVSCLPEADRQLLEQGVRADSLPELTQRLEDYLS